MEAAYQIFLNTGDRIRDNYKKSPYRKTDQELEAERRSDYIKEIFELDRQRQKKKKENQGN